ncbi:hypothetical protein XELAEV_18030796mg [Xenopus laevis]|uniref:Uncharacterized protein n=1 Tax=Xenopus laevis TaxID=8355 RepID=A0A974CMN1_XENLA|nr:hypothetical protein XELAEV_18030796mg [Xenopus laevis]
MHHFSIENKQMGQFKCKKNLITGPIKILLNRVTNKRRLHCIQLPEHKGQAHEFLFGTNESLIKMRQRLKTY